ncbi:Lectin C-type domain protein [Aphelenchoides bicaudatus]|nr:Lectin C-type domain protein [Aphelenchoides bicaudatus]
MSRLWANSVVSSPQKVMWFLWPFLLFANSVLCFHKPSLKNEKHLCPEGWDLVPHNNQCYLLVDRPMPQNLAQKYCSLLSSHAQLAHARTQEQNDFLQEYAFSAERIWLQAKAKFDIIDSRASLNSPGLVLRWKNDNPVLFTNWMEGNGLEQMNSKKLCVVLNRHGKWMNADCGQPENFVCEVKSVASHSMFDDLPLKCPNNWSFNPKSLACYRGFSEEAWSWLDADRFCGEEGAKHGEEAALASVHTHSENQFLTELAEKSFPGYEYVMLGAIGHSTNANQWDWIDGTSFASFSNWQTNRPSGSRKAAVLFMRSNGQWINSYADKRFKRGDAIAICKFLVG